MKYVAPLVVFISLFLAAGALAENGDRKARQNLFELEPLYTRNARNVQRFTINLTYDNFKNVALEEANEFDGYTTTAEIIVPFGEGKRWEIRFEYPFYTDGEAELRRNGESIDIDGNGGVFDFATLVLQRELSRTDESPVNSSIYFGGGTRSARLETSTYDVYNHNGNVVLLGLNIDNARADRNLRLQTSLEGRSYFKTDDLNPSKNDDDFLLMNLSAAAVYNANGFIKPAFEILFSGDFNDRQIVQAVPQLIVPLWDRVEIKAGYAFGDSKGEGSTQTGTIRTTFSF